MKRKSSRPRFPSSRAEGLESRSLLTAGISGGMNLVMELGGVSRDAALQGVEVAAPIASHGSITFVFEAEAAGDYLLKVRHVGDGLTLEAAGPSGSAGVDPGPAGPFETIALPLKAAEYRITASAAGDQPVFVDWELLLTQGVGQSAAISPTLAAPPIPLAASGASAPVAAPALASAPPPVASPPPSVPVTWGGAISPAMVAVGGPAGRPGAARAITPVGPTSPGGWPALANAGDGLLVEALKATAPVATEVEDASSMERTQLLAVEMLGDHRQDLAALGAPTWLDGLPDFQGGTTLGPIAPGSPIGPSGPEAREALDGLALNDGTPHAEEPDGSPGRAASPGLIATGLILASALGRWRPGLGPRLKRAKAPTRSEVMPRSMG